MSDETTDKTRIIHRPLDHLQGPAASEPPDLDRTSRVEDIRGVKPSASAPASGEGKTVLFRPPSKSAGGESAEAPTVAADATSKDPVVGWLVVVKGPGRGNAVQLGYGWNTIGRDVSQRVCLDYGDMEISRLNHAKILYDPRSRKFSLTLGEGTNPTYVRGEALLAPTEIHSGDEIQMGKTDLLFIALCGEKFDWSEES